MDIGDAHSHDPVTQETFGHVCSCAHAFFQDAHESEHAMAALTYDC